MARSTTFIDLHGKVKYIHAVNLSKYGKWSVTIYPTEESLKKIREMKADGLKNEFKRDEGGDFMSFHREPVKEIKTKAGITKKQFMAPRVVDADKQPMDGMKVGWGSDVTVRLEVYKSTPGSQYKYYGARWDSLRVDNLVPFNPEEQLSPEELATHKGIVNAEEPEPW